MFTDAVEQMLVGSRTAPARGDTAQLLKVKTRRLRDHCVSDNVIGIPGNRRSRYFRT